MTDWATCPAVERRPGKLSGAWTFAGTRVPVSALFENLESGATVDQFLDWFPGVDAWQVRAVLEHEAEALRVPAQLRPSQNPRVVARKTPHPNPLPQEREQEPPHL